MLKLKIDQVNVKKNYVTFVGDIIHSDLDECYKTYSYLCSVGDVVEDSSNWIGKTYNHLNTYRRFISKKGISTVSLKSFANDWFSNFSSIKAGNIFEFQMKCRYFFQFDEDSNFAIEKVPIDENSKLLNLNKIEFMVAEGGLSEKNKLYFETFTKDFCEKYLSPLTKDFERR